MKKKVLIVDDEQAIRDAISFCLLANDYNVMLAEHGEAALEAVERCDSLGSDLEMIILDVDMPIMSGGEFLAQADQLGLKHPVILMSGSGKKLEDLRHTSGLVQEILPKPFSEHSLLEKVRAITGGNG